MIIYGRFTNLMVKTFFSTFLSVSKFKQLDWPKLMLPMKFVSLILNVSTSFDRQHVKLNQGQ